MPKMMANMDPEQLEEMKAMQQGMAGGSLKDMFDPEKLKEKQKALENAKKGSSKKNKD